jgi:predicted ATPase/DNA-binding CsgD family transcriptional regulator
MPSHLPAQLTTFVGRETELRAVAVALHDARLLTVLGPGGCGKTRLAVEVARGHADVCWVDLATTDDPLMVPTLLAAAAGVLPGDERGSPARQIADRRMLICLDNCEHVRTAAADLTVELLRTCPGVTVLATSREPLGVAGEVLWRVPPLSADDAVTLFEERAGRPADRDTVRIACVRLDGIPLAIELAAAWTDTLSAREILQGLDDRFALLVRGPRGVAARHQTLAASMAWSHDLLDGPDRVLFRRLGVFHGGFTLETAGGVCAAGRLDVMAGLRRLVDKSLVIADTRGRAARYRMLETIGRYAVAKLEAAGELEATRDRHLATYLDLTEEAEPLLAEDKDAWRARVGTEQENLRAAIAWGLSRDDPTRGRELAARLPWLWHLGPRGHEGLDLLQRAVRAGGTAERTGLQARLLTGLALVADTTHPDGLEYDAARAALEIATEVGDARTACLARLLSAVGLFAQDLDAGWALAESAREQAREAGDGFVTDAAAALMGIIRHLRDEHDDAMSLLREAVDGLVRRGDRGVASTAIAFMACGALYTGDVTRARALAVQAVETARPLADHHRVGSALSVLASVEAAAGRIDEAYAVLAPVIRLVEGAEPPPFVPGLTRIMGWLHLWEGRPEEAAGWFSRETAWLGDDAGAHLSPPTLIGLAAALRAMGDTDAASTACGRALAAARRVGMPRVVADALEQSALASADPARAEELHHEALALRAEHGLWLFCVDSLEHLATLAEPAADAARLLAACARAREDMGLPRRSAIEADGPVMSLPDAVAYARRARGRRGRPSSGWASLTPTEQNVVRLAVQGLSNPDIGSRLFMSRSTVKTHLSHVYAKLGVTNRTELATRTGPHLTR